MKLLRNKDSLKAQLKRLEHIRNTWDNTYYRKAVVRAQKMSTHEILNWIDTTGSDMAKIVMEYRKHGNIDSLSELRLAISYLQAMTEELIIRQENEENIL